MEVYEFFKYKREETGMSVRKFCEKVGISVASCVGYQNGTKSLLYISLEKAVQIFSVLDIDIEQFYEEFFPELKEGITDKIKEWEIRHQPELAYVKLRSRYRNYIAKIKERKLLPTEVIEQLQQEYKEIFNELEMCADSNGNISESLYRESVVAFSFKIKQRIENEKIKNPVSKLVNDYLLRKEMTYVDLAAIVDLHTDVLTKAKLSLKGYSSMNISSVLRICYALDVPVNVLCDMLLINT